MYAYSLFEYLHAEDGKPNFRDTVVATEWKQKHNVCPLTLQRSWIAKISSLKIWQLAKIQSLPEFIRSGWHVLVALVLTGFATGQVTHAPCHQ